MIDLIWNEDIKKRLINTYNKPIHELKIKPKYFEEVKSGNKTFEVRKNDRDFREEDLVVLKEYANLKYTGRFLVFRIGYMLDNKSYCKEKYVIFSLKEV